MKHSANIAKNVQQGHLQLWQQHCRRHRPQSGTYLQVWQLAKSSLQAERQEQHSLAKKFHQLYLYLYL